MKIYEINEAIERMIAEAVDPETGELNLDYEALDALTMERDAKVENLALFIKNRASDAAALDAEIKALTARMKTAKNEAQRCKDYLAYVLQGQKFETPRVAVSFRRSQKVELEPGWIEWAKDNRADLLRLKEPEADKVAIGKLLKSGEEIPGATLADSVTMTVK